MKLFSFKKKHKISFISGKNILNNSFIKNSTFFSINYSFNYLNYPRLGIYINKKYIKLSNKRNLIKRIIREHFRINKYKICNLNYIFRLKNNLNLIYNIIYFKEDIKNIFSFFYKNNFKNNL